MRSVLRIFLVFALGAFAGLAQADPPGRVARLNHAVGTVSFAPGEAPDQWGQAVINRPLTGGDRLWADRDGRGEFHVGSTAVRLGHVTNVDVLYLDDDRLQLRLGQGAVNVRVREMDADDIVEIATPAGAVVIRQPGSYRVTADAQTDNVRVVVNFGQAELVTPGRSVVIPSGQAAVIDAGGQTAFEVAYATGDEFDRWSADRDRSEDRIASTRYVSSHMTGYEDLDRHGTWQTLPEYGAVWLPARVAPGWAPYRHGHWTWVSPWGWTWVDDAPWGFAPFHYGRWVHVHDRWAWAPGPRVRRPVYAPALVAFVGGSGFSFSVHSGPAVGWFPLGWREPYRPWYRASPTYVRNVNVTHVTNVTNVTNIYRNRPDAVTVVPQQAFLSRRSVNQSRVNVAQADLARAQVIQTTPAEPSRASLAPERVGQRPPAQAATREVVAVTAPAAANARELPGLRDRAAAGFTRQADDEPRVRVIQHEGFEARRAERSRERDERRPERTVAPAAAPAAQAPASSAPIVAPAAPAAPAAAVVTPAPARQAAPAPAAPPAAAPAPSAASRERFEAPRVRTEQPQRPPRVDFPRERSEGRRDGTDLQRERFERRREAAVEGAQPDRSRERAARHEIPAREAAPRQAPPQRDVAPQRPASPAPAAVQASPPPQRQAAPAPQQQQQRQEPQRAQRHQQREGSTRPGTPPS